MFHDYREPGVYAPLYYADFQCIADQCRHSCCIDWEICIDEKTLAVYQKTEEIMNTVTVRDDGACFALTEEGRCPHLNDAGLCDIILSHGEEYLSEICRNHPRFFNRVQNDIVEAGLGIVCEEACRLILENEEPFLLVKIEETDDLKTLDPLVQGQVSCFDPLMHRDQIISMIEMPKMSFDEKCALLKQDYQLPAIGISDEWIDRFLTLEVLDSEWAKLLHTAKGKVIDIRQTGLAPYKIYYERLLSYFVYRHVSVSEDSEDLRARLAFAILSVEMIRWLFETGTEHSLEQLIDCARQYSAEIEYSEDNTDELIFMFLCML